MELKKWKKKFSFRRNILSKCLSRAKSIGKRSRAKVKLNASERSHRKKKKKKFPCLSDSNFED